MSRPRSLAAAGAAVLLALSLAGCGSDGDGDKKADAKPLSASEFKEKALDICKDVNDKIEGYDPGDSPSDDEMEDAVQKVAKALKDEADDLAELTPPKDIADDVDAMLKGLRDGADVIAEKGKDVTSLTENPLADAAEKAQALDLGDCAS